ncbi:ArsR/SmtB family transcription factor [Parafrankia discariae]|uniref:ArsR/SmtB family transcription factor n=1 Tax=Parafrankia discariae TaxID=365528 RepID=UPI0003A269E2|nr:metalloregulator ArsR/SmtB family transcription factor [Parafrankia discariae]
MGADQLSQLFAALTDPTRRNLVARLTEGDATVGELAAPYDMSVQAVSKHLKVLEQAGLVSRAGVNHRSPVHLEAEVFDLMTGWIERYRRRAEQRYRRLDALLAEMNDSPAGEAGPTSGPGQVGARGRAGNTQANGEPASDDPPMRGTA